MSIPGNCKYTKSHMWVRVENGNIAYVGITDHAAKLLGDIVWVQVATVGQTIAEDEVFGELESVKVQSDLYMPVQANVLEFNDQLRDGGELLNEDPYNQAWIVKIELANPADLTTLMDATAYLAHINKE